ncbi:acetyltransferase component of pyruvate dehydrogenase complex [Gammaproteobacteria bacterium]|nr:acetyltransferase component of pyruvate dehydrogenase complex [Gammaproteobacteria bacterium]
MAIIDIKVPDIGNFDTVDVIEVLINVGDMISIDQTLLTLESDKASMDVPADIAGKITEVLVKVGDKIKEGDVIGRIDVSAALAASVIPVTAQLVAAPAVTAPPVAAPLEAAVPMQVQVQSQTQTQSQIIEISKTHASPSVRAFARELGVDLNLVIGTAPKNRIIKTDVTSFIKNALLNTASSSNNAANSANNNSNNNGLSLLAWPKVDFAKFGAIEKKPLSRIKKISGANLARNWAMIPHVTQFDEADITELESLRVLLNKENEKSGKKVTILAFLVKACTNALQKFPEINSSLDGDDLVLKQYYHIGFAADTPNGLVVPVIRDCDQKGVMQIAAEMGELAKLARDGKLKPDQMQGGTFTISSLGGIGGTAFTPIINAPEVAILGVSRSAMKPVWNGKSFEPRLMVPLSLSYDHRVVDGAMGARFITYLNKLLTDMRRALI